MFSPKLLVPCAMALTFMASTAHALISEDFNGSSTSFTGSFDVTEDYSNSTLDRAVWLHAGHETLTTSFRTFATIASLDLVFWYAGAGTVSLTGPSGYSVTNPLEFSTGLNPGLGAASAIYGTGTRFGRSYTDLAAGTYTLSFGRSGDYIKIDDVSLSVTPVPEPSTIALMLAGLSIVGFAARRNKRST